MRLPAAAAAATPVRPFGPAACQLQL